MDFAFLGILISLNALFAMAEIALIKTRKARLQKKIQAGDKSAAIAAKLCEHPNEFLSTVQIGITSIGILSGIVGESAFIEPLEQVFQNLGWHTRPANYAATFIVLICITFFSIVFGELVPKRLGQISPEPIACKAAIPMLWLSKITKPFVAFLAKTTELLLKLVGSHKFKTDEIIEEEIHVLLAEGSDAGVIKQQEHEMVRNIFRMDDRRITTLMIPRNDIIYLDIEDPLEENIKLIQQTKHSRFPICRKGWEEIIGILDARKLLSQLLNHESIDLTSNLKTAHFVPETMSAMELLKQFKTVSVQMIFVVDEYGEIQGMVTMEDLIEGITGELQLESQEEAWAYQREDGSWLLDGLLPLHELKDCLQLQNLPEEGQSSYNTLSGMIMLLIGHVPKTGDKTKWQNWFFEIVDMDGYRIDKVLANKNES